MYNDIFEAIRGNDYEGIKAFLPEQMEEVSDKYNCKPLHLAIWEDRPTIVQLLISEGADVNAVENMGNCGLMIAARSEITNRLAIMDMLLQTGADPNVKNNAGNTAIFNIIRQKSSTS